MEELIGPAALECMEAIQKRLEARIEEAGRKLGIPKDSPMLLAIVKLEEMERLEAKMDDFRAQMECWHREETRTKFHVKKFLQKVMSNIVGILKDPEVSGED